MKNLFLFLVVSLLFAGAAVAATDPGSHAAVLSKSSPMLEMVFVIDTTGSMGGLIQGAKQKVWSIVNEVMKSPKHPKVKVGLVAYRDRGDVFVTKVLPLTSDLDKVYTTLMDYSADGGGDEAENVRHALADGVHRTGWSQRSSRIAQILFLVGDSPPHNDYQDEPDTAKTAAEAVRAGIIINTIQCGTTASTTPIWQAIARQGEGQYFAIAQDGGVNAVSTPYDTKLSKLGNKIGSTYLAYGGGSGALGGKYRADKESRQMAIESKVYAAAPMSAQADRAVNKAINSEAYMGDLLQDIESGKVKLEAVKQKDLPNDLQKLTPVQLKQVVAKRLTERKDLRAQILQLSKQRDAYIHSQTGAKSTGFDAAVSKALTKQLAQKGIKL